MLGDISKAEHIYIAVGYTDMRKQIDGLSALVTAQFRLDPFSNSVFLFCGRNTRVMKALYWEGDGFVLLYKRLENGRFKWPIRIFDYKPDRKSENPQKFLKNFSGTLISDGYGGYNNIEGAVNAYCWAHARRKFYEALPADMKDASDTLAYIGLKKIAKLFAIEKEIDTLPPGDKVKIRQEKSKPLVDDFFSWCVDAQNKSLTRSKIGKAIQYALNLEKGLRIYLDDGLVPMTNSLDERNIRPYTIGRKNWIFSTSTKGADASASIYSLVETAKANRLNPFDYIEYILEIMPQIDIIQHPEKIDWFMPWSDQIKEEFGIKDD